MQIVHSDIPEALEKAADILVDGGLLIAPTESSYMLTARGDWPESHERIADLKQRPADKPLPFIAGSIKQVRQWAMLSLREYELAEHYWPGPLTLVVRSKNGAFKFLGRDFAIRVSSHPWTRELASRVDFPLISTSANVSGEAPLFKVSDLLIHGIPDSWTQHLELIIDGGTLPERPPSTIVRMYRNGVEILREGAISREDILRNAYSTANAYSTKVRS